MGLGVLKIHRGLNILSKYGRNPLNRMVCSLNNRLTQKDTTTLKKDGKSLLKIAYLTESLKQKGFGSLKTALTNRIRVPLNKALKRDRVPSSKPETKKDKGPLKTALTKRIRIP